MASVDFLMTRSAVTIAGRPQIVERRRGYAKGSPGISSRCATWQISVALQAHETNFLSYQHSRLQLSKRTGACSKVKGPRLSA
jgi:hypothetical protein